MKFQKPRMHGSQVMLCTNKASLMDVRTNKLMNGQAKRNMPYHIEVGGIKCGET